MEDCLFCKIISGEIPSKKIYEDELTYVFEDIAPTAPIHYLVIPKQHISKLDERTVQLSHISMKLSQSLPKTSTLRTASELFPTAASRQDRVFSTFIFIFLQADHLLGQPVKEIKRAGKFLIRP